ncbi:MAG: hypothetical protein HKN48_00405 [Flavobacteriaceae bacterium]|nr:hypothetical protein [Flavobacteriaceae bacterium]
MIKKYTPIFSILLVVMTVSISFGQVGIRTSTPKSIIDLEASNTAAPSNTDGILIPRIDTFPATNPGADQDGMLVFLSTDSGWYKKGIHFWDNSKLAWIPYGGEFVDSYNVKGDNLAYAKQATRNGSPVVILDNGRIGMGTEEPTESLELKFEGDNDIQVSSVQNPNAPNIIFYTANGSFASRDFLNDGDPIGSMAGTVWNGSGRSEVVASVSSLADGDHSSGNLPTKFEFNVTQANDTDADNGGVEMTIRATGRVGIGTSDPTATLELKDGGTNPGSAPLKFNAGTNLSTPEAGAFEYDGTHLYFTPNSTRNILMKGLSATATLDFPILVNGVTDQLTVSVPGATPGSSCNCAPLGSIENDLKWSCFVSAANTVTVRLSKLNTSDIIDPASKSWKVTVIE